MEVLYVVLIIVVIFIAILAAAIIGNIVVRNNRKRNKPPRPRPRPRPRPQPPIIPDIINGTIPGIISVDAPNATKSTVNSVVAQLAAQQTAKLATLPAVLPVTAPDATMSNAVVTQLQAQPPIRIQNIDDLTKYYVAGNDPFVQIFNDELKDYVEITLNGHNQGYAEIIFDHQIDHIIEETVSDGEGYAGDNSEDSLNSNPYERLRRIWELNQPRHAAYLIDQWSGGYSYYLELCTRNNDNVRIYEAIVEIVYTPSAINHNNGNILRYQVDYMDNDNVTETQFYNIDDRDTMIRDMNIRMPSPA